MSVISRAIGIVHYNRPNQIKQVVESVMDTKPLDAKVYIADDGSQFVPRHSEIITIAAPNRGVCYNKNRILFAAQNAHFICILEDDLVATEKGWFEGYEECSALLQNHYWTRVQNKEIPETIPAISEYMKNKGYNIIYGDSPRGDLTFLSQSVIKKVGAFNPMFLGVGHGHREHALRVVKANLIFHPTNKWVDVKECRDKFKQIGDTENGRWSENPEKIQKQLERNRAIYKKLRRDNYIYCPLEFE